jgi:hypothetical protein
MGGEKNRKHERIFSSNKKESESSLASYKNNNNKKSFYQEVIYSFLPASRVLVSIFVKKKIFLEHTGNHTFFINCVAVCFIFYGERVKRTLQ